MTARVYDLQAHASRRGAVPQPLVPGAPSDTYQRLAGEVSAALAAVRAGRNSGALRERIADLANAVRGMAGAEFAIGAVWDEAYSQGAADYRRPGGAR